MEQLNPRQDEAVRHLGSPLLVLAGAGSGKTRVITAKIAFLIRQCGYKGRQIAAVTFTNKAAREMKARVAELLKGGDSRGLQVSTFHTLGLEMLKRDHRAAGLRPGFSIFDEQDVERLLRELASRNEQDREWLSQARRTISRWKDNLLDPATALAEAGSEADLAAARLYAGYTDALAAYNALDFDDLILRPLRLLRDDAEARERWQNRFRHLLVDEYQDTNSAQYQLMRLLTGIQGGLTAVGDDDQSIYAWRGARPENLAQLGADFPNLKVVKLEQNYRSTSRILRVANQLIGNNPHLYEKRLWSGLGLGDSIRVLSAADEEQEAELIVSEMLRRKFQAGLSWSQFAILYRGNHQSRPFEKALRSHRIPYHLSGGTAFFAQSEIKDLMAYLRLLANPDDDAALLRIINTPRREIGPATLERLGAYAAGRKRPLLDCIDELGLEQQISGRPLVRLREFAGWYQGFARFAAQADPVAAMRQLISDIGYLDWLQENSSSEAQGKRRIESVEELVEWIGRLAGDEFEDEPLPALVNHLLLMDILERQDDKEAGDRVSLMTLHAAKGLEFDQVFLVGMEEEILPHRTSLEEGNLEEERRLAYVGITRARKVLTLSYARKRRKGGEWMDSEPSRFLAELPAEDLDWPDPSGATRTKEEGRSHLDSLRNLLSQSG